MANLPNFLEFRILYLYILRGETSNHGTQAFMLRRCVKFCTHVGLVVTLLMTEQEMSGSVGDHDSAYDYSTNAMPPRRYTKCLEVRPIWTGTLGPKWPPAL